MINYKLCDCARHRGTHTCFGHLSTLPQIAACWLYGAHFTSVDSIPNVATCPNPAQSLNPPLDRGLGPTQAQPRQGPALALSRQLSQRPFIPVFSTGNGRGRSQSQAYKGSRKSALLLPSLTAKTLMEPCY